MCARRGAWRRWLLPVCGRQRLCARLPSPDREAHLAVDFACRSGSSNCPAMPSRTVHGSHGFAQPTGPGTGDSAVVHSTLGVNCCCRSRSRCCHYLQQLSVFPSGGSVAGMDMRQAGEPGTGDGASASGSLSRPATPSDPQTSGPNTPTGALGHPEGGHPATGTSSVDLYGTHGLQIPNRHSADAMNSTSWGSAPNPGVCPTLGSLQCCAWHAAISLLLQGAGILGPKQLCQQAGDQVPLPRARCSQMSCLEACTVCCCLHSY